MRHRRPARPARRCSVHHDADLLHRGRNRQRPRPPIVVCLDPGPVVAAGWPVAAPPQSEKCLRAVARLVDSESAPRDHACAPGAIDHEPRGEPVRLVRAMALDGREAVLLEVNRTNGREAYCGAGVRRLPEQQLVEMGSKDLDAGIAGRLAEPLESSVGRAPPDHVPAIRREGGIFDDFQNRECGQQLSGTRRD
jgi:hypothetical protein